jgi:formamidase
MPEVVFSVDQSKSMADQAVPGHNRWHPDIPPAASVRPGSEFRVECREWTDAQLSNNDSANDVRDVNLNRTHMLSGPIEIQGAEPGDLLVVDLLDLGPVLPPQDRGDAPGQGWGYTGIFAKVNGGGFLTDHFPDAYKAIWDFHGQDATSRHIPGVRYTGITHPGLAGTAPSAQLLAEWNRRERNLINMEPGRVPPLAYPPNEDGALAGTLGGQEAQRVCQEGARTVPGRENGGNMDIKNFTRGSRAFYPVYVPGAKFSVGDLHFSQGDGEITFCGAIEMGGFADLGVDLIKDGMNKYGVTTNPVLIPGRVEPRYTEFLTFTGVSVHETTGDNYYLDATIAYRRACLNAIEYLKKFGYSGEQAYLLLGSAPIEGRISGIVDIPNACCSLYLPTEIFDFPVRPAKEGPQLADRGSAARTS